MNDGLGTVLRLQKRQLLVAVSLGLAVCLILFAHASASELPNRSIELSDNTSGTTARYDLQFDLPSATVVGSIRLQFCSNDPLINTPCTAPAGFDSLSVTLASQSGETGFIVLPSGTNANTIVLSRVPALTTAATASYELDGITNPSASGSYYVRLETFASGDASGSDTDYGGLAFSINSAIQISTVVPPYLLFCSGVTITGFDCNGASGSYINMGTLTAQSTASATSQLLTATNAASGFTISISGLTMTSGNNVIDALATPDVSRPGVAQFGLNLVANTTPLVGQNPAGPGAAAPMAGYNQPDFYKFVSGDTIASAPTADDLRKLTVSYITNMQQDQPIGVYVATLTYVCLANF